MQTVTNLYIGNLAVADIVLAIFCIPFQFEAALLQRWDLPPVMCQLCPTLQILSVNISVWTLVAICLDRFKAILYPLRRQQSKLKARIIIMGIWVVGLLSAIPYGLAYQYQEIMDEIQGGLKPFCSLGPTTELPHTFHLFQVYCVALAVLEYFLPVLVMSMCYAKMGYKLWGQTTPGQAQKGRDDKILRNKKKVIQMLLVVVGVFSICWLPWQTYLVTSIVYPSVNEYEYINVVYICSHWLAMSNSCYNPFIYGIYSEKFQREFRCRLFCFKKRAEDPMVRAESDQVSAEPTDHSSSRVCRCPRGSSSHSSSRRPTDV